MTASGPYAVLLSGGLDSAVAAAELKNRVEVFGIHMKMRAEDSRDSETAAMTASSLGIELIEIDCTDLFEEEIIRPFVRAYLAGTTPSPCVNCNRTVKFGHGLEKAVEHGASRIASGHYARIRRDQEGRARIETAMDRQKDQSYFLSRINPGMLENIEFPLGSYTYSQVRQKASELELPCIDRKSSVEICFASRDGSYDDILESWPGFEPRPGKIVDSNSKVLGDHAGIHLFTIGQRRGLDIGGTADRLYVTAIYPQTAEIVVGPRHELERGRMQVRDVAWHIEPPDDEFSCTVQIRSLHEPAAACVKVESDQAVVNFIKPQTAVTPGQAAVFRQDGLVLGSGWICR